MDAQTILVSVAIGTSLAWILAEAFLRSREQRMWRRGTLTDIAHAVFSNALVNAVLQVGIVAGLLWFGFSTSWLAGKIPPAVEIAVLILFSEVVQYWVHRWMHSSELLWRFHRLHHSAESMDWLTGFSKHPVESGIRHIAVIIPALIIGFSPLAWLGLGVANLLFAGGTHVNALVIPSWLDRLIVTPHFHSIHHSRSPEDHDSNFAGKLSFIDAVFGTAKLRSDSPGALGLDTPEPEGYIAQVLAPFRRAKSGATESSPAPTLAALPLAGQRRCRQ